MNPDLQHLRRCAKETRICFHKQYRVEYEPSPYGPTILEVRDREILGGARIYLAILSPEKRKRLTEAIAHDYQSRT